MRNLFIISAILLSFCSAAQTIVINEKIKFLALGDSYTIGQSVPSAARWPVQLTDSIRSKGGVAFDVNIIATTGWRTDNLKSAITSANLPQDFNLVSLLIGVNNYYQGKSVENYIPEFVDLLQTAVALAGGDKSRVFVVSIPDYGYTPFGESNKDQISAGINAFNAANKSATDEKGILYINITDISRRGLSEPDLVAGDGLHPSEKQYTAWVRRILQNFSIEKEDEVVTAVTESKELSITVSPNPFTDSIIINDLPSEISDVCLILTNMQGQQVSITSLNGDDEIKVGPLPSGLYVASVFHNERCIKRVKLIRK